MSRADRVAALIKIEVAKVIPRLNLGKECLVSITDVWISDDLGFAKIFVSMLGDEKARKKALRVLSKAKGFVRHELRELELRIVPELRFIYDDSLERGSRIIKALNELNKSK
jgi:ribosome-binding factor A